MNFAKFLRTPFFTEDLVCEVKTQEGVVRRGSVKKGALINSAKCTGKHQCQRFFFNKVAGLRPATLLKKSLWQRCFSVTLRNL